MTSWGGGGEQTKENDFHIFLTRLKKVAHSIVQWSPYLFLCILQRVWWEEVLNLYFNKLLPSNNSKHLYWKKNFNLQFHDYYNHVTFFRELILWTPQHLLHQNAYLYIQSFLYSPNFVMRLYNLHMDWTALWVLFNEIVIINMYLFLQFESTAL